MHKNNSLAGKNIKFNLNFILLPYSLKAKKQNVNF
jgi:hypothetical protein